MVLAGLSVSHAAPRDLTAQVSTAGLDLLEKEIPPQLPTSFTSPGGTLPLVDCPFTSNDTVGKLTNIKANFKVSSLGLTPLSTGRLEVTLKASATGDLDGAINPCYLGEVKCHFDITLSKGTAVASFLPQVSGNKVILTSPSINLDILQDDLQVQAVNCGALASILNSVVVPAIKKFFWEQTMGWFEDMALDFTKPKIEQALTDFTEFSGTVSGFNLSGQLQEVSVSSSGLRAGVKANITSTGKPACSLPSATTPALSSVSPSFSFQGEHLGVALAASTVQRAVSAAWSAGFFCLSDSQISTLGLPSNMKDLIGFLFFGLSSLSSIEIHAHQQPKTSLLAGTDGRLEIVLPGLDVLFTGKGPGGDTKVTLTTDFKVAVKLRLDPVSRAVMLELITSELVDPKVTATNSTGLSLDANSVKTMFKDTLMPIVETQFTELEILPQILRQDGGILDPYYLYIARAATTKDHVNIYATVYKKPASDSTAPNTTMDEKPSSLTNNPVFRFVASGTDGLTPTPLLRFSWRVNSGAWSTPDYSRAKNASFKDGKHKVEVRAVDLQGNLDATPAEASFEVDATLPEIKVTAPPPSSIDSPEVTIGVEGSDNRSSPQEIGISVKVEVQKVGASDFEVVREDPPAKGLSAVDLKGLAEGGYRVTFAAVDEAGNTSQPVTVTFGYGAPAPPPPVENPPPVTNTTTDPPTDGDPDPSTDAYVPMEGSAEGGCSFHPRRPLSRTAAPLAGLALLLLGIVLRRRRA